MKRFSYKAKDKKTGKVVKGSIQADNEQTAGHLLIDQGYIPDSIAEEGASLLGSTNGHATGKDRITFTRQLATLIGAGLPISNSLRTVADQTQSRAMKSIVEEITTNVESGKTLYDAFSMHKDIFNNVYLSLIKAGESSGTLDIALKRLADQEEKDAALLGKIRGALVYPAIIFVVIIAVLAFMMIMVVPQVEMLYSDMGKELPALTQFLVGISQFFGQFWWFVLLLFLLIVGGSYVAVKHTSFGREVMDSIKIHTPIFGKLFLKLYVSRFARTAEMMLETGVPMLDSIKTSIGAVNNVIVEKEYTKSLDIIKGGKPLSTSLEGLNYMLPLIPQMVAIGEESGKIDEMLGKAAQTYETELDEQVNNISTMIEPILMVIMAGLIGVVIGGTLLPIYSLVNSVSA
ncbi:type II secretion system F family protein [Candidatus Saccharibacteria bacterium]|nr:type II secretion system F family protein [Candidatus Saccharibacteria bacterium]